MTGSSRGEGGRVLAQPNRTGKVVADKDPPPPEYADAHFHDRATAPGVGLRMGRWSEPRIRGWMQPRPWSKATPEVDPYGLPEPSGESGGVETSTAVERVSSWARGLRPLRRREGIPSILETPGFVHRRELDRARSGHRWVVTTLLAIIAGASIVALGIRTFLG